MRSVSEEFVFQLQPNVQVCQMRVMTEFETITLTKDGAVDFKTIIVFQNSIDNHFFSRSKTNAVCLLVRQETN